MEARLRNTAYSLAEALEMAEQGNSFYTSKSVTPPFLRLRPGWEWKNDTDGVDCLASPLELEQTRRAFAAFDAGLL